MLVLGKTGEKVHEILLYYLCDLIKIQFKKLNALQNLLICLQPFSLIEMQIPPEQGHCLSCSLLSPIMAPWGIVGA